MWSEYTDESGIKAIWKDEKIKNKQIKGKRDLLLLIQLVLHGYSLTLAIINCFKIIKFCHRSFDQNDYRVTT